MHMQGTPQTMQDNPHYDDVVAEILDVPRNAARLRSSPPASTLERICLDPGIGFGKTHAAQPHAHGELRPVPRAGLPAAGRPLAQRLLGKLIGDKDADRAAATAGAVLAAAAQGVQIVRVHDVRLVREALLAFEACGGLDGVS